MATLKLHRFSNVAILKTVSPRHLVEFFRPHATYLTGRGLNLPSVPAAGLIDFSKLIDILMSPAEDTPNDLLKAIYLVDEMSTADGMDKLLDEMQTRGHTLDGDTDRSPTEVAIRVWLIDPDAIEKKHEEQYLIRAQSFVYYQMDARPQPKHKRPTSDSIRKVEGELDMTFKAKNRGGDSRVFVYPKGDEIWFMVRHGDPFKLEGAIEGGKSEIVGYRPEKYDVVVYAPKFGGLRVNANSDWERELYRNQFGRLLFNRVDAFPGTSKYTLDPLRELGPAALNCDDVDGIDWIRLKEVHYYRGGPHHEIEKRLADDVFEALATHGTKMPERAPIIQAKFQVKFTDCRSPRMVTIKPSNIARFTRDHDSTHLESWFRLRGFDTSTDAIAHEHDESAVVSA